MRDLRGGLVRTALGCLVLGTLTLAGCAEKQEASTTLPPLEAAPTTEEALVPLGPPDMPMPEEARRQTADGAQAFTEYYVELYNHAMRTLDSTYMRDLSSGCDTCTQLADQVEKTDSEGRAYVGGTVTVLGSTPPHLTGDEAHLVFDVKQAPLSITINGDPANDQSFPEHSTSGGGGMLRWDDTRTTWVMTQWIVE